MEVWRVFIAEDDDIASLQGRARFAIRSNRTPFPRADGGPRCSCARCSCALVRPEERSARQEDQSASGEAAMRSLGQSAQYRWWIFIRIYGEGEGELKISFAQSRIEGKRMSEVAR